MAMYGYRIRQSRAAFPDATAGLRFRETGFRGQRKMRRTDLPTVTIPSQRNEPSHRSPPIRSLSYTLRESHGSTRLRGGGCSPDRTGLTSQIPCYITRHSPDDSRTGVNSSDFLAFLEARRELRAETGGPNGGRGVDLAIFPGILDALLLSVALECITIERLTPALVAAAAVVPRSAAKCPGTLAVGWRPRPSGRRHSGRGSRLSRRF